jgi:molybdopterin-guanine dinucleotide biosynthesis protein A
VDGDGSVKCDHEAITGLIVAGGKSTRFGSDKATAVMAGRMLVEWVARALAPSCERIVVVHARGQHIPRFDVGAPVAMIEDVYEAKGPLAGLVAGLQATETPLAFGASCDVPLIEQRLVTGLASLAADYDIVIPQVDGFLQPLLAVYRPESCLPAFRSAIEREILKITAAYGGLRVRVVREQELRELGSTLESFANLNRPDDLARIETALLGRERIQP